MDDAPAQSPIPWTPREEALRVALQRPDRERVRTLLDAGANIHARDVLGGTALHVAVNFVGDPTIIGWLLDRGAKVNALNDDGFTPLLVALRQAHYRHSDPQRLRSVVELLLARGGDATTTGRDGELPVRAAMDPVNLPLIQLLLSHGATMPDDGLDWALSNGSVELVKAVLVRPSPAMLAHKDPNGGSMLHRAVESPEMLFAAQWLVRHGADPRAVDDDGMTPFGRAAFHDNLPAMAWLHGLAASTMQPDAHGQTPLHLAAFGAQHEVLAWLIARGASVAARDAWGRRPLDIAIDTHPFAFSPEARKLQLVTLLGGSAADVARGRFSNDPLHAAVSRLDLPGVQRLLQAGANANVKDASGHTPLYWALAWSSTLPATPRERAFGRELLPLLIRHGADPDLRMGDGSPEETYTRHAETLGLGALLKETIRRHQPATRRRPPTEP